MVGETAGVEIEQAGRPAESLAGGPARKEKDGKFGQGRSWPEQRERQQRASGASTLLSCGVPWSSESRGGVGEELRDDKENEEGLYGGGEVGGVGESEVRGGCGGKESRGVGGGERAGDTSS